jgi:hypothetical protein
MEHAYRIESWHQRACCVLAGVETFARHALDHERKFLDSVEKGASGRRLWVCNLHVKSICLPVGGGKPGTLPTRHGGG